MNTFAKIAGATTAAAGVAVLGGYLLPKETLVERSTTIQASPETVFGLINDLEKHQLWSSWKENDPTMEFRYGEKRIGEGARYTWTSRHSGAGSVTITRSVPEKRIEVFLDFGKQGTGRGFYDIGTYNGSVSLTESFSAYSGKSLLDRYFGVFMRLTLPKFFDSELAALRKVSEKMDQLQTH
ncbi:MAG: SRPBCC family protein [Chitinispirillaceae bacterium]